MVTDRGGLAFQHRRLETFLDEIGLALEREDRRQCETAAFRLQGAMHAHFDVEAQVIFPSIRGRRPELARELDALERDQQRLLLQLDTVCTSALASDAATLRVALADFRRELGRHEQTAESILGRAHGEDAAPPGAPPPPGSDRPTRPR